MNPDTALTFAAIGLFILAFCVGLRMGKVIGYKKGLNDARFVKKPSVSFPLFWMRNTESTFTKRRSRI